jgi:hypothetical protein
MVLQDVIRNPDQLLQMQDLGHDVGPIADSAGRVSPPSITGLLLMASSAHAGTDRFIFLVPIR